MNVIAIKDLFQIYLIKFCHVVVIRLNFAFQYILVSEKNDNPFEVLVLIHQLKFKHSSAHKFFYYKF